MNIVTVRETHKITTNAKRNATYNFYFRLFGITVPNRVLVNAPTKTTANVYALEYCDLLNSTIIGLKKILEYNEECIGFTIHDIRKIKIDTNSGRTDLFLGFVGLYVKQEAIISLKKDYVELDREYGEGFINKVIEDIHQMISLYKRYI